MEWLKALYGKTVSLDTAPLIYFIEENPAFLPVIDPFFDAMVRGKFDVVTSTVTITEVLVHPIRQGNATLTAAYRDALQNTEHLRTVPVTAEIAEIAAQLRASHRLRTPDAIQVATAIAKSSDFFLTNDNKLSVLSSPTVLVLKNLASASF